MASSPNVSHYRVVLNLLLGRWTLADKGVMDRAHLRWFTPGTFRTMFENPGVVVEKLGSVAPLGPKAALVNRVSGGRLSHLLIRQINLIGRRGLATAPAPNSVTGAEPTATSA